MLLKLAVTHESIQTLAMQMMDYVDTFSASQIRRLYQILAALSLSVDSDGDLQIGEPAERAHLAAARPRRHRLCAAHPLPTQSMCVMYRFCGSSDAAIYVYDTLTAEVSAT